METEVSSSSLLIGVDVGGNNSDSVLIDNSQSDAVLAKSDKNLSYTTADVKTGIKNSITSLIARA
jgi:N-methylhydantoinase A/oxoprolinase/acetone carboxylase beta subunit